MVKVTVYDKDGNKEKEIKGIGIVFYLLESTVDSEELTKIKSATGVQGSLTPMALLDASEKLPKVIKDCLIRDITERARL